MKTLLFTNGKTMLKTIMKTSIHLPMAAMFLAAVLAGPAAAGNQVPFKGQSSGVVTTESFDPVAGIIYIRGEGEGEATHLGRFTVDLERSNLLGHRNGARKLDAHCGQRRHALPGVSGLRDRRNPWGRYLYGRRRHGSLPRGDRVLPAGHHV